MGYWQAFDMARYASKADWLWWHLTSNHYPPLNHNTWLGPAGDAIEAMLEGQPERLIRVELPDGAYGLKARELVHVLHLEPYLDAMQALDDEQPDTSEETTYVQLRLLDED